MSVYTKTTNSDDNVFWENLKNPNKISDDNIILICHRNTLNKKLEKNIQNTCYHELYDCIDWQKNEGTMLS